MNQLQQIASMSKEQIRQMLAKQTERYQKIYGGEVTRYASPENVKPLLNQKPGKKPANLKQAEWEKYLEEVKAGTYKPDTQFQTRAPSKEVCSPRGTGLMEVQLNATVDGKALWANPKSTAAKAYGIAKCVNLNGFVYYTAVRFSK